MNFKQYLKDELAKPVNNEQYNPDGNSERAVVTRGFWREVVWQYKAYPERLICELKSFRGMSTELGWFLQLPIMILLSPVLPIFAARHWHDKSIKSYMRGYDKHQELKYKNKVK